MILTLRPGVTYDTATRMVGDEAGVRDATPAEAALVADHTERGAQDAQRSTALDALDAGAEAFRGYRAAAAGDVAVAATARAACATAKAASDSLAAQADAFAAARTGDLKILAQGVGECARTLSAVAGLLTGVLAWRGAVDENAVHTDDALMYLALLARRTL